MIIIEKLKNIKPLQMSKNQTMLLGDVQSLYAVEKEECKIIGSYIHAIYSPLADKKEISALLEEVPTLPKDYVEFLQKYNGLNAFSDSLCLYGFGRICVNDNYIVSRTADIVLPYHLGDYSNQNNDFLIIGSYCEQKLIYIYSQKKYALLNKTNSIIATWSKIDDLINQCLKELASHYDSNGKLRKPTKVGKIIFNKIIK